MPVYPRPPRAEAVVQVEAADPPPAESPDRFAHHRLGPGFAGQVIACAEEVTGIQADADPPGCVHPYENLFQVLEPMPEAEKTLPSGEAAASTPRDGIPFAPSFV